MARVGSTKAKYKFSVSIEEVYFEVMPVELQLSVSFVKGNRRTETKERVPIGPGNTRVQFHEDLEMINTIYTLKKGAVQEKMATFFVNCYKKTKPAKIGYAKVDLSKFIHETVGAPLKLTLLKTPKNTKAYLRLNICAELLEKSISDDLQSVMSGVSSLGDFDDLGMGEPEPPQPSKIGAFQPPTIPRAGLYRGGGVTGSGPVRALPGLEEAEKEDTTMEEQQPPPPPVKKSSILKVSRAQIVHRSGLPAGFSRDITEIKEDDA